ncbi:hypothetical protein HYPSUDRAFT_203025 [Hypholoma sublateritium FD-334 SS-4]|uniref:Uncharacterized protein n=1 Tax=Hypholoma sublateritium (strain FD-334 SS-4) TaxID=945553 RepID=A0A0D2NYA3_HYPSF|nr:hypothetical protein HYPSUDRAFT_203025 [Hypholoma sublateritium FD-334 SS-4]
MSPSSSTFGARSSDEFANCSSQIRHCCYVCHALTRIWTALTPCFRRSSLLAVPLPLPPPPPARHSRLDAQPDKNGHAVHWASPTHVSHVAVSFGRVDWAHCPVSALALVPTLRRPVSNVPTPSTPTSPYRAVTTTTASPSSPSWTDLAPPTTNLRPPSSPPSSPTPMRLVTPEPPRIRQLTEPSPPPLRPYVTTTRSPGPLPGAAMSATNYSAHPRLDDGTAARTGRTWHVSLTVLRRLRLLMTSTSQVREEQPTGHGGRHGCPSPPPALDAADLPRTCIQHALLDTPRCICLQRHQRRGAGHYESTPSVPHSHFDNAGATTRASQMLSVV